MTSCERIPYLDTFSNHPRGNLKDWRRLESIIDLSQVWESSSKWSRVDLLNRVHSLNLMRPPCTADWRGDEIVNCLHPPTL